MFLLNNPNKLKEKIEKRSQKVIKRDVKINKRRAIRCFKNALKDGETYTEIDMKTKYKHNSRTVLKLVLDELSNSKRYSGLRFRRGRYSDLRIEIAENE